MPIGDRSFSMMIFVMILGVMFPVFGYAFTFDTGEPQTGMISQASLIRAGLDLGDSVSHLVNGSNIDVDYVLTEITYYVSWDNVTLEDFWFTRQHEFLPSVRINLYVPPSYTGAQFPDDNVSDYWNNDYRWTHISIQGQKMWLGFGADVDAEVLFTIPTFSNGTEKYATIQDAIDNGEVQITIGRSWSETSPNLFTFANWMTRLITGVDTYGMPDILIWMVRIFSMMALAVGVMLVIEIIPL